MPIIKETIKREQTSSGIARVVKKSYVIEVPTNGDPLGPTSGMPQYGATLSTISSGYQSFIDPPLRCTKIDSLRFVNRDTTNDTDLYECDATFTDEFLPLLEGPQAWTYSRKEVRMPFFRRYDRFYPLAGGTFTPPAGCPPSVIPGHGYRSEWISDPLTIYVPYLIQTRVVWVKRAKFTSKDRRALRQQIGRLHMFKEIGDQNDDKAEFGIFEPPRVVEESRLRVRIEYAWAFDPGNGPFQQDAQTCKRYIAPNIARPPFYAYRVIPGVALDDPPTIDVYSTIPGPGQGQPQNPYYQPDGWKTLPGMRELDELPV